jgi:hypothetical protein
MFPNEIVYIIADYYFHDNKKFMLKNEIDNRIWIDKITNLGLVAKKFYIWECEYVTNHGQIINAGLYIPRNYFHSDIIAGYNYTKYDIDKIDDTIFSNISDSQGNYSIHIISSKNQLEIYIKISETEYTYRLGIINIGKDNQQFYKCTYFYEDIYDPIEDILPEDFVEEYNILKLSAEYDVPSIDLPTEFMELSVIAANKNGYQLTSNN